MYRRCMSTAFIYSSEVDSTHNSNEQLYIAEIESSQIYILNGVGLVVWELLELPMTSESIISEITDIYGVDREDVADSIFRFLDSLEHQGLIENDDV